MQYLQNKLPEASLKTKIIFQLKKKLNSGKNAKRVLNRMQLHPASFKNIALVCREISKYTFSLIEH